MFSETVRLAYLNAHALVVSLFNDEAVAQWALILALVFVAWVVLAY
jgi:hypothetical protein